MAPVNVPAASARTRSRPSTGVVKTAVIGASGYVGRHLLAAYRNEFSDCVGTSFSQAREGLTAFDIRRPDLTALRLEDTDHRAVLIASAKPNIGYCDQNVEASHAVNVAGMLELIRQVARTSMQVIFLSSDYVFDGKTGQFDDDHATGPSTEYGRQKVAVERELPSITDNYLILRLSKIFGDQKGDGTLLDEIAASLAAGRELRAAEDQFFCPTHVDDLTQAILGVQARGLTGTLNVCSPERWSRYAIATTVAEKMSLDSQAVQAIHLHDLPGMSERPLDTSMVCSRLAEDVGTTFTPLARWIDRVASQWRAA